MPKPQPNNKNITTASGFAGSVFFSNKPLKTAPAPPYLCNFFRYHRKKSFDTTERNLCPIKKNAKHKHQHPNNEHKIVLKIEYSIVWGTIFATHIEIEKAISLPTNRSLFIFS
ncbi:MAG: hypothetical protein KBT45_09915 [Bacteroidales bacterium]|nr:hypothetical protein [Candidatus Colimorpha pelethequi]